MILGNAVIILLSVVLGIALGCAIPFLLTFRLGKVFSISFIIVLILCSPMVGLGAVTSGFLFGGWGEELMGTAVGVPIGVFVGCYVGSLLMSSIVLCISLVFGLLMRRMMAQKCDSSA
jgi:hypothetical protein